MWIVCPFESLRRPASFKWPQPRILAGTESDILKDGSLDFPDDVLAEFDVVIASVHIPYSLGAEAMTERILRAVAHPAVSILAHPTGRLLLEYR